MEIIAPITTTSLISGIIWCALCLLLSLAVWSSYQHYKHTLQITRWKKRWHIDKHQLVFADVYRNINGFTLSQQARAKSDAFEYVYGEIDFAAFCALFSLVAPPKETIFYDLGSGVGKAVTACAMVFQVKKSIGIELFPQLHHAAISTQQALASQPDYRRIAASICYIHGDILQHDFADAHVIFINATAWFGDRWQALNQRLDHAHYCHTIITISKKLLNPAYQVTDSRTLAMSWGVTRAYIHKKI